MGLTGSLLSGSHDKTSNKNHNLILQNKEPVWQVRSVIAEPIESHKCKAGPGWINLESRFQRETRKPVNAYGLVSERKLGIFSKIKEGENYNHPA